MQAELLNEARRQAEICNACRYCEGFCSVFPALQRNRAFSDGDLMNLANLCHNCRSCYYACQYTAPHEFDHNLPRALAELRRASWQDYAWPQPFARLFHQNGIALALALIAGFVVLSLIIQTGRLAGGEGFYAVLSHNAMVVIFVPAFLFPLLSLAISLNRYWRAIGGGRMALTDLGSALRSAANMRNLQGGHGDGCNFEDEDRFSHARRHAHHAVMYGFLLCLASTSSGAILHYLFDMPAPYGFWSLPKLLGVPGGLLIVIGCAALGWLKIKAERKLGDARAFGGEMAFILVLLFIALTGLALYALGSSRLMPVLLAIHLGAVLAFFVLTPFTKMAHGFYRLAALAREHGIRDRGDERRSAR